MSASPTTLNRAMTNAVFCHDLEEYEAVFNVKYKHGCHAKFFLAFTWMMMADEALERDGRNLVWRSS